MDQPSQNPVAIPVPTIPPTSEASVNPENPTYSGFWRRFAASF